MKPKSQAYRFCVDIMRFLAERDFTNQATTETLEIAIKAMRGGDPRTVKNWLKNLTDFGFIKLDNVNVWSLNFSRVPEILNLIVKRGQKKLM